MSLKLGTLSLLALCLIPASNNIFFPLIFTKMELPPTSKAPPKKSILI